MKIIREIKGHYCDVLQEAPISILAWIIAAFFLAYGSSMFLRPEQFDVLVSYQVISRHIPALAWGAIAWSLAFTLLAWPALSVQLRLAAAFGACVFWALLSVAILAADGINSGVTNYGTLAIFSAILFSRYDPGAEHGD